MRRFPFRWQRLIVAACSGILLSLSFAPFSFAPIAYFAFIPLFMMLNKETNLWSAFVDGWVAGYVFFVLTASWLIPFGWLPWLGVSAVQAIAFGLASMLYTYQYCFCRIFGVPALWVLLEMLRSYFPLGGFAWARVGESLASNFGAIGMASWIGTWGASFIIIMTNVMLTVVLSLYIDRLNMFLIARKHRLLHVPDSDSTDAANVFNTRHLVPMPKVKKYKNLLMFNLTEGEMSLDTNTQVALPTCCAKRKEPTPNRLTSIEMMSSMNKTLAYLGLVSMFIPMASLFPHLPLSQKDVAIVGIAQAGDVRKTLVAGVSTYSNVVMRKAYDMQKEATIPFQNKFFDFIIWPENGVDANLANPDAKAARQALTDSINLVKGVPIITGEYITEDGLDYNSFAAYTLTEDQQLVQGASVRKKRLVPFGEWYPLKEYLQPYLNLPLYGEFTPGEGAKNMQVNGYNIGGVICYESAYPDMIKQAIDDGAQAIVVATNNSSFGASAMSEQHLLMSKLRAVEYGRDVVHASIGGESGIIRATGEIITQSEQFKPASLEGGIYMRTGRTLGSYVNQYFMWFALILFIETMVRSTIIRKTAHQRLRTFIAQLEKEER